MMCLKMNAESKIDSKGRICIPNEIRKMLNLKPGEKILFQVQDDKIILRKSTSIEEFIKKEENRLKFVNKKQFIDLAVHEFLRKLNKKGKTK